MLDPELEVVAVSVEEAADVDEDGEPELVEVVTSLVAEEETLLAEDEAETLAEDEEAEEEEEEEEAGISFAPEIQLALMAAPTAFFM